MTLEPSAVPSPRATAAREHGGEATNGTPPATRRQRAAATWMLAGALVLYAALAIASMRHESPVFDESIHLPPGYAALTLGDYWVEPFHPPLVRSVAALPLLALDVRLDADDA